MLKEPGRAAQSKSFLWAQMHGSGPPVRLFTYSPTRNTQQAAALYAGTRPNAALMTDGYAPYDAVAERYGLVHLACWAHARRYLVEAEETLPKAQRAGHPASMLIEHIGKLFAVEAQAKGWLFCDTVSGANASANLYSLVETAKANSIDPYQYLVAAFKALPHAQTAEDYEALLPWNIVLPAAAA